MNSLKSLPARREERVHDVAANLRISQALQTAEYQALRKLEFSIFNGVLVIRGCVESFFEKQVAQELARRHLDPEIGIDNQILVKGSRLPRLERQLE